MSFEKERKFREELWGEKDEVVYHYCSIEALYGIVSSRSIWLTSLESSNDKKELQLANSVLKDALIQLKEETDNIDVIKMYKQIESATYDIKISRHIPKYKFYALSLVKDKDSLTHWERYGNNSKGVCIGINIELVRHMLRYSGIPEFFLNFLLNSEIIYSYQKQVEYAKDSIINLIDGYSNLSSRFNKIDHIFTIIYYNLIYSLKPLFKHSGFKNEKEYRIYLKEGCAESEIKDLKKLLAPMAGEKKNIYDSIGDKLFNFANKLEILTEYKKYNIFGNNIRSYYSLNLGHIWSDTLIQEIVLGPKCFQNKKELKGFLKANSLDRTKITVSEIPLR